MLSTYALLALAGTAIAAPALEQRDWNDWTSGSGAPEGHWGGNGWKHGSDAPAPTPAAEAPASTSTFWAVETAYVTMTGDAPSNWAPSAPAAPVATPTPEASPAAFYSAPAASAAPAASSSWGGSAPVSDDGSWQSVVAAWRSAAGLGPLSPDSNLEANALKTATDGNGQMVHELNSGSMAQVLAPGDSSDFESVYVGGWLCEVPGGPGLNGICPSMVSGWDHSDGETGHADILTSSSYTKIGCALADGIWACDLA